MFTRPVRKIRCNLIPFSGTIQPTVCTWCENHPKHLIGYYLRAQKNNRKIFQIDTTANRLKWNFLLRKNETFLLIFQRCAAFKKKGSVFSAQIFTFFMGISRKKCTVNCSTHAYSSPTLTYLYNSFCQSLMMIQNVQQSFSRLSLLRQRLNGLSSNTNIQQGRGEFKKQQNIQSPKQKVS